MEFNILHFALTHPTLIIIPMAWFLEVFALSLHWLQSHSKSSVEQLLKARIILSTVEGIKEVGDKISIFEELIL